MSLQLFDTILVGLVRLVCEQCVYSTLSSPNPNPEDQVELGFSSKPINIILYLNYIFNKLLYNINLINLVIKFYDIVLRYILIIVPFKNFC